MDVSKLTNLIAPPEKPIAPGTPEQWCVLEKSIGTPLPADYKALVDTYGQGWFKGLVSVLNPLAAELSWQQYRESFERMYSQCQSDDPEFKYTPSFPLYPAPGGLLLWGWDYNCGVLCWITEGEPNEWPTISLDNKYSADNCEIYNSPILELLYDWLSGGPTFRFYDSAEEDEEEPQVTFFPSARGPYN